MKLLLVLEDLMVGGAQIHAADLAQGLARCGWAVDVAVLGDQMAPCVRARFPGRVERLAQSGLRDPRTWARVATALGARPVDVAVAVNQVATCVTMAAAASGRLQAPVVSLFHTTRIDSVAGWLRTAPFLAAVRACAAVVFVSEAQRRHWARFGLNPAQAEVIANGVDSTRFAPVSAQAQALARTALGLAPDALVFGLAAAFRREKNHGQLVEALARLCDPAAELPAQALLVGEGPTRPAVAACAQARGVSDRVRFCGELGDVRPALAAMSVGVLCSTAVETSPLFALEAMASGLPVVAPRLGGLPELISGGRDGLLFPPGDTDALCAALRRCADPAFRAAMGRAAREKAVAHFTPERMVERYAGLLDRVVSDRADPGRRRA